MGSTNAAITSLFTFFFLYAVSVPLKAQQKTVTIQPQKPAPGDTVTITYHPDSPYAEIKSPDSLKLIFSTNLAFTDRPDTIAMKKTTTGWKAKIPLSKRSKFAAYYFKSGRNTDKNRDKHQYEFLVYKNGKPVKKAYYRESLSLKSRYPKASEANLESRKARIYSKELKLYPDNYTARIALYASQLKSPQADSTAILKEAHKYIHQTLSKNPQSAPVILNIKYSYRQIGEKAKGDSIQKAMAKKYPHSDIAMYNLYRQAKRQNNKDKQVQMLVRYINADYQESYVNKIGTRDAYVRLFKYYAKHDSIKKMKRIARLWLQPNPRIFKNPKKAIDYYRAANIIVNNTHQYELALQYARKALQLLPNEPVSRAITTDKHGIRPILTYKSKKEEIKQRKKQKARILTTLSAIYKKQEEFDQAKTVLKRAITLVDNDTHLWQHDMFEVAETYQQTNHPRKAFYAYRAFLRKKPLNNYVLKKLKESYIAYNGSAKGFKKHVKDLQKARSAKQKKLKKQWVNKQAPSLAHATDLKGVSLDTTSLAGKVIVLDFWATWCGPCKASFPHIQKVYDQFKDNPDVKFVILNSAWNNSRKQARKWTQKQSYTFPFYYDKGSKITTSYGVRGIPTTFVIDKNARIQFKDIGNSGTSMEQKLTLKINMALGENEK